MKYFKFIAIMLLSTMALTADAAKPRAAQKWVNSLEWANGWNVAPDKSVNVVEFADQYARNKELWDAMFRFLAENDLDTLAIGRHQIVEGRCWADISEYTPKLLENSKFESHKKFVDLQYVLRGNEMMGLPKGDVEVKMEYNDKRDVAFWTSNEINFYPATPDTFFLFFPSDKHMPSVQADGDVMQSRKICIKIEYVD